MFREVWKIVKAEAEEVRIAETERGRSKEKSRKEARKKGKKGKEKTEEEEAEKKDDNRDKEDSGGIGNLEGEGRSCRVKGRSKKTGPRKVSQVDKGIW